MFEAKIIQQDGRPDYGDEPISPLYFVELVEDMELVAGYPRISNREIQFKFWSPLTERLKRKFETNFGHLGKITYSQ